MFACVWVFIGYFMDFGRCLCKHTFVRSFVGWLVQSSFVQAKVESEYFLFHCWIVGHLLSIYISNMCPVRFTHVEFMPIQLTVEKIELTTFTHFYLRITHKIPFIYVWYTLGWNIMVSPIFYNFKRDAPRSTKCIPLLLYIKCLLILSGRKSF